MLFGLIPFPTRAPAVPAQRTSNPVEELLIRARRLIEKGWCQRTFYQHSGLIFTKHSYCVLGAFRELGVELPNYAVTEEHPALVLFHKSMGSGKWIVSWNDDPLRKKEEVLAAFDRAIELARAEGR